MRIDKFLGALLPSFKKDNLREEISSILTELEETAIPVYESAADTLGKVKFVSKETMAFQKNWERTVKIDAKGNYVIGTLAVLQHMRQNLGYIQTLVEKNFVEDVFRDAMTFLRANVIQYVETMGFVVKYARKLLLWTFYELSMEADRKAGLVSSGLSKAEVRWLAENAMNYLQAMNAMGLKRPDLESHFRKIPDATATVDNVATIESTVGTDRTDPFKMNFIPTSLNPFFFIGKKIAEYQVSRYNVALEEKKALEMRLLNFRQQQEGRNDPKLQQAIEYSEDRLLKLNYKLREMEAEYLGE